MGVGMGKSTKPVHVPVPIPVKKDTSSSSRKRRSPSVESDVVVISDNEDDNDNDNDNADRGEEAVGAADSSVDYDVSFGVDMDVLDAAMTDIESQFESFTGTGTRSGTVASTGGTGSYRTCSGGGGRSVSPEY